ncbi:DUF2017 domain-containing protein [soil metagenome]
MTGGRSALIMRLDAGEADALRTLLGEMQALLGATELGATEPRDEVIRRLFPRAYQSPEEENAYRELVGDALRQEKEANLKIVAEGLRRAGERDVIISPREVGAWLAVLTDMRLAIGTRLEVTEESMAEAEPHGPEAPAYRVLHWLGWLQESILRQMGA